MFLDKCLLVLTILGAVTTWETECDSVLCSNVFDPVCGLQERGDGIKDVVAYKNLCFLLKSQCELPADFNVRQIPDFSCGINKDRKISKFGGRRVIDNSIVGSHQACNHTCPTFCVDTYEPACAMIWKTDGSMSFKTRPMINHCHIDMFSCAFGVNVTIAPLGRCYSNSAGLLFVAQVAALKSLKLLDVTSRDDFRYGDKIYSR